MLEKVKKNIFIALAGAIIIYLILIIYADFSEIESVVRKINWYYFLLLFSLSFLTFLIKFIKWEYGLSILGIRVGKAHSLQIFMSSLTMSITPGKIGDLLKSYLLKKSDSIPVSKSSPIVLVERITEFLSLLFICLIGIAFLEDWLLSISLILIILVLISIVIANENLSNKFLYKFSKIRFFEKHINNLIIAFSNARLLLKPKSYFVMLLISITAWIVEGLILYLILQGFNVGLSLTNSILIFAFSILFGSISMIPGGLGLTEGSMTYLLVDSGIANNISIAATILFRIITLWFSLAVGSIALLLFQKRIGRIISEDFTSV